MPPCRALALFGWSLKDQKRMNKKLRMQSSSLAYKLLKLITFVPPNTAKANVTMSILTINYNIKINVKKRNTNTLQTKKKPTQLPVATIPIQGYLAKKQN